MRCDMCDNGDRRPGRRPYVQQRGERVAVVTDVPIEECPACGEVWLTEDVALRLDVLLTDMLTTDVVAIRPYDQAAPTAA
jgi:YgiT-type zinc finger domain-containing protein